MTQHRSVAYIKSLAFILKAVGESRNRMQGYSPEEKIKLEGYARATIKKGAETSRLARPSKRPSS